MRDFRKFCRPNFSKNSKTGDPLVKLKCGEIGAMSEEEYVKVLNFFEIDSFIGEDSPNSPGNIVVTNKETGKQATFSVSDYNSIKDRFEIVDIIGSEKTPFNNHEYVDLGLPSGTLWATMNVGASSETEVGNYYKFGETTIYDGTDYNTSAYTQSEDLPLENDAANANFGGSWHIPTKTLWNELINNTTHTWINDYNSSGVNVIKFAKTDDSSIFIIVPATGSYQDGLLRNPDTGYYWASTLRYGSAEYAVFTENSYFHADWKCAYGHGLAVRAVCDSVEGESLATIGDIVCHNNILNTNAIFSYDNWLTLDDSWDAIDLYGIETFDDEDEVTEERYVILSNGTTFIIKSTDYSLVSSHWEHVDTISVPIVVNEYVDLDLPSGTLWATKNIGAENIYDVGNFYKYGTLTSHNEEIDYYDGQEDPLSSEYDVATQLLGEQWSIPTKDQLEELIANTDITKVYEINGVTVEGTVFTSKVDSNNYIFIPASGYKVVDAHNASYVSYILSSTPYSEEDSYFLVSNTNTEVSHDHRWIGLPVRPVINQIVVP